MITVKIPLDKNFDYKTCKKLYRKCRKLIGDDRDFRGIVENTYFYSFYLGDEFLGCIYCYYKDDKLFLNGFAGRHHHKENMESMKLVLSYFSCDIYAETKHKTAAYCLIECGFKKIDDNLYKYER